MIFNYFAKGGKGGQNIDKEMNEANGCTNESTYKLVNKDKIKCMRFDKTGQESICEMGLKDNSFKVFSQGL